MPRVKSKNLKKFVSTSNFEHGGSQIDKKGENRRPSSYTGGSYACAPTEKGIFQSI